jgi:hypothetical protein
MFGTLKPHTCRLGCDRRRAYETFYCGLCQSLGHGYGTLSRALLNYDAVFLALCADGLMDEAAAPDRCRCPMMPVTFRPTVSPSSPAMRYAAAMQMLLSDQWLADRAEDGRRAARAARPLIAGKVAAARATLAELSISLADLDGFERVQAAREVPGVTGPREAAEPTAAALERVFARMADLPGVTAEARGEEGRAALGTLGRHLGSAIYLVDALDDLPKDHRGGAFNPCLVRDKRDGSLQVSWPRVEAAWSLLHDDLAALDRLATALPLRRHRDLVHSVIAVEMRRLARAAAEKAHAYAAAEARARRHWPARALASIAAAFVMAWVWLCSFPAIARGAPPPPRGTHKPDAGTRTGKGVPKQWTPKLPPSASAAPSASAPPLPSASAPPAAGSEGSPPGEPSAAPPTKPGGGDTTTPAEPPKKSPGGGGGGCPNPCSDCDKCCDWCKECPKACDACKDCGTKCGELCKSCDCGKCDLCKSCDCGKMCDCGKCDCCKGDCCKGCDCGKGCDGCCSGCNSCGNCGSCCK